MSKNPKTVTLKFKLGDLFDARQAGANNELRSSEEIAGVDRYRIGLFLGEVRRHLQAFDDARNQLIKSLGVGGVVAPDSKNLDQFTKQVEEMRNQEVEIKVRPVVLVTSEGAVPKPVVFEFFPELFVLEDK